MAQSGRPASDPTQSFLFDDPMPESGRETRHGWVDPHIMPRSVREPS
jgi:hypothetical protein